MCYLLIWDIDGTLIHSRGVGRRAMDLAFAELYNIPEGFSQIDMAGRLDAVILSEAYRYHGFENQDPGVFFSRYCEILEAEVQKSEASFALSGIMELLETLNRQEGFYNVLGTGNIERGARIKLEKDGLNRYFSTGGFGNTPTERWQVIQKAVENSCSLFNRDFANDRIFIIGDTPRDMECAKRLGTKAIGTATGPYTVSELMDSGADYAFGDLTDTEAFLRIFSKKGTALPPHR